MNKEFEQGHGISNNYRDRFLEPIRPSTLSAYQHTYIHEEAVIGAKYLPWDSKILGLKCARIDIAWLKNQDKKAQLEKGLAQILKELENEDYGFLDIRVGSHANEIHSALQHHAFDPIDELNIYVYQGAQYQPTSTLPENISITFENPSQKEIQEILEFGIEGFHHSRVFQDPNITTETAHLFYKELLQSTLQNAENFFVRALSPNGKTVGFCIGGFEQDYKDVGYLWLIAIDPAYQRQGIAKHLVELFVSKMQEKVSIIEIGTQANNKAANQLYQSIGLEIKAALTTYHRWNLKNKKSWSAQEIIDEYRESSTHTQDYMKVKWASSEKMINRFHRAMDELPFDSAQRWLDAGCGTGTFQKMAKEKFPHLHALGIDISPELLSVAKENNQNNDAQFVESDFLEFTDHQCDILTSIGVLQKTNIKLDAFFTHAREILSDAGILYIETKNLEWEAFDAPDMTPDTDMNWFTAAELKKAAENQGFEVKGMHGLIPEKNIKVEPHQSHTIFMICSKAEKKT